MSRNARRVTRRKGRGWKAALGVFSVLLVLIVGAVGVYAYTLSSAWDGKTTKLPDVFPSEAARPPVVKPTSGTAAAQNILLLGSDTRGSINGSIADLTGQRSDTIMVVHIPADRKNIYVMSIMRDSWVDIPGQGKAKINAAMSYGGVPLVVQTIEGLIGARIDRVAVVDFGGFQGVTDALGGVTIDNPVAFTSSAIPGKVFAKGPQQMNGAEALAFVRERYAFRDGDFQRARNQQLFLKAVMGKALTAETLTNPGRISNLVSAIAPFVAVDSGFNSGYLIGLGAELRNLRVDNVTFFTAPTAGTGTSADGQSIVNIDWAKFALVKQAFQTDRLDQYKPEFQTIP